MGKWAGTADPAAESAGGGGGSFTPAPRGFYTIQVADFLEGVTKESNRPKLELTCEIADEGPEFGKKVWLTITQIPKGEKGHGMMIHSLHAFGLELGESYEFDTSWFQGQKARVLLGIEPRVKEKNGRTYHNEANFVEALYTEKHPEPQELPPAPAPREKKSPVAAGAPPAAAGAAKPSAAMTKVFGEGKKKAEVPF